MKDVTVGGLSAANSQPSTMTLFSLLSVITTGRASPERGSKGNVKHFPSCSSCGPVVLVHVIFSHCSFHPAATLPEAATLVYYNDRKVAADVLHFYQFLG